MEGLQDREDMVVLESIYHLKLFLGIRNRRKAFHHKMAPWGPFPGSENLEVTVFEVENLLIAVPRLFIFYSPVCDLYPSSITDRY